MPFARKLVNSGRLSQPCSLDGFPLQTPAVPGEGLEPGTPCPDAPVGNGNAGWLLNCLGGDFSLLHLGEPPPAPPGLRQVCDQRFGPGRQRSTIPAVMRSAATARATPI